MIVAYLDNGHIVSAEVIQSVCAELGVHPVVDMGCAPIYKGDGEFDQIGRECRHCGAPLGSVDPDDCKYVILATCSDCME